MRVLSLAAFAFVLLMSGCIHVPERLDASKSDYYMRAAADLSGRSIDPGVMPPIVYMAKTEHEFLHMLCKDRGMMCGYSAVAVYLSGERIIIVNGMFLEKIDIGSVLVHEMTHYLQAMSHDRRSCMELEVEAYSTQYRYSHESPETSVFQDALNSCMLVN